MVQILRSNQPSFGERLGAGLASGISSRFAKFEEEKKMQQQRGDISQALQSLGYKPEIAERLAALDQQTLRQVLNQDFQQGQTQQKMGFSQQQMQGKQLAEQQAAQQSDEELKSAMTSAGIPEDAIEQIFPLVKQYPPAQRAEFIQEFAKKIAEGEEVPEDQKKQYEEIAELTSGENPEQLANMDFSDIMQAGQAGPLDLNKFNEMFISGLKRNKAPQQQQLGATQQAMPQVAPQAPQVAPEQPALEAVGGRKVEEKKKPTVAEILRRPSSQESAKEQEHATKEGQKVIEEIEKENKGAEEIDRSLKRMSKLIEEGGLPTAALYTGLNELRHTITPTKGAAIGATLGTLAGGGGAALATGGIAALPAALAAGKTGGLIGGSIGAALNPLIGLIQYGQKGINPNQQEFEKLSQGFLKFAKNYFPRLTERELVEYMKTVPTLSQTDAGKKAIIKNMGLMNRIYKIKNNVLQDVIEENDGKIPKNLRAIVDKRAAPRIKGIEKLLEEGLDDAINLF